MSQTGLMTSQLLAIATSSRHRYLLVLAGDDAWLSRVVSELRQQAIARELLYVGDQALDGVESTSAKQAMRWLGRETDLVIMDARQGVDADALGAVAGIIRGGGLLVLLRHAEGNTGTAKKPGFVTKILESVISDPCCVVLRQDGPMPVLPGSVPAVMEPVETPFVTQDQANAVDAIVSMGLQGTSQVMVLTSDRGRGKSSSLGIAAAQLMQQGCGRIIVTAPRYLASEKIFEHAQANLEQADFHRGSLQRGNAQLVFNPPDQLLDELPEAELLLVDEAAAIPVPLLTRMLQHYAKIVFATTVHGYEGTGRGFALRFFKVLDQQRPGWINIELNMPARWAEHDPLENWLFNALCLDAEIADDSALAKVDVSSLQYRKVGRQLLLTDNNLLRQVFALLVLAHYRTRPSDLQRLLDDESISLYIAEYKGTVLAVCLVTREGNFESSLATAIYRGERRPQGHLLAQTLAYHCGSEQAASLDVARIMRIAVHPLLQSKTIGSKLLRFVVENEKGRHRDLLGTSFGATPELIRFWQQAGFETVRIGFTREHTSGEHAAVMIKPLSGKGEQVFSKVRTRFVEQWPYWLNDPLRNLPGSIIASLASSHIDDTTILNEAEHKDLLSYIRYQRSYETCLSAIVKFVRQCFADQSIKNSLTVQEQQLLQSKVVEGKDWQEVVRITGLSGKNEVRSQIKSVMTRLYKLRV